MAIDEHKTNIKFDHIYCFTAPELTEVKILEENGFTLTKGREHTGQGTANRSVLCANGYIELIYVYSSFDAALSPLKLLRRSEWQNTNASPFGIAMKGVVDEAKKDEYTTYVPPYLPDYPMLIHNNNENFPSLPMYFVMNPETPSPKLEELSRLPKISHMELAVTERIDTSYIETDIIRVETDTNPSLVIQFENHQGRQLKLNSLLTFIY